MSKKIYINQPYTIRLNTKADLTNASSIQIRIKYPKTVIPAYFVDASLIEGSNSIIEAFIPSSQNTQAGTIEYWAWIIFPNDPGAIPGEPLISTIYNI